MREIIVHSLRDGQPLDGELKKDRHMCMVRMGIMWVNIIYVVTLFQDVFLFDSCEQIFVWIGQNASPAEKRNGMTYAHVSWDQESVNICVKPVRFYLTHSINFRIKYIRIQVFHVYPILTWISNLLSRWTCLPNQHMAIVLLMVV